ncbi:MAG: nitrate- and nitrite sensing domain-containing protein, partial [Pseudomonadota bacterium]
RSRFSDDFNAQLVDGLARLDLIPAMRDRVQRLDVPTAEAIGTYTATNALFLGLVEFLPKISSVGELGVAGTAYAAFLQSKERAGIERAVLANTFARDAFAPGFYDRFRALVTTQDVYLDVFRAAATPAHRAALDELLAEPAVARTQEMRVAAIRNAVTGGFGVPATDWFAAQTQKINLLKGLENELSSDLRALAQAGLDRAAADVRDVAVSAGAPLLAALLVCFAIAWSTLRQLGADPSRLEKVMTAIADDDLTMDLETRRPATGVFAAAQTMQKNLKRRIEADRRMLVENGRIREALGNVSGLVMIAGRDDNIVFANDAMRDFIARIGGSIARTLGRDRFDDVIGVNLDAVHDNVGPGSTSLSQRSEEFRSSVVYGGFTVDYVANPVISATGERIGTVFEWTDRTEDLKEEARVKAELAENGRIREALTNVDGMVMIAGEDERIVYANTAMADFFKTIRVDVAQIVPAMSGAELLGASADALHAAGPTGFFRDLTAPHSDRLEFGEYTVDYTANPVRNAEGEHIGTVFEWNDRTDDLAEEVRVQATLAENGRIREALTNAAGNVFIAGPDNTVVFANHAAATLYSRLRPALSKQVPGIAGDLEGANVDQLHELSVPVTDSFASLGGAKHGQLAFGGHTVDFIANPVFGEDRERIGTVFEWIDRTAEVTVGNEVQAVVDAALSGDLTQRIDMDGKEGFFASLSDRVNQLVDIAACVIDDTVRVFGAVSKGNLTETINREYHGQFNKLKTDANATIAKLTEVVRDIQNASSSVRAAANDISRGNNDLS